LRLELYTRWAGLLEEHGINIAEEGFTVSFALATPTPTPTPVPWVEMWDAVHSRLDSSLLEALERTWYYSGWPTEAEEVRLRAIHQEFPFGQPDFNTWLRQTLRQIHEIAAWMGTPTPTP
jgi:hypothetical protein